MIIKKLLKYSLFNLLLSIETNFTESLRSHQRHFTSPTRSCRTVICGRGSRIGEVCNHCMAEMRMKFTVIYSR